MVTHGYILHQPMDEHAVQQPRDFEGEELAIHAMQQPMDPMDEHAMPQPMDEVMAVEALGESAGFIEPVVAHLEEKKLQPTH